MKNKFSIILTINGEYYYLQNLISKLISQKNIKFSDYELIIVDANPNYNNEFNESMKSPLNIKFFNIKNISRTKGLNYAIQKSSYEIVVRMDVRTVFNEYYLHDLILLYENEKCSNVGFIQKQIYEKNKYIQKIVSKIMNNKYVNGLAKYRLEDYNGEVDTLYLGCFNKKDLISAGMYDENNPLISEDADLNFRLKKLNKKIFISSKNTVNYMARDNLKDHFKKIIEYGISKAIFFKKHYSFSNIRQLLAISFFCTLILLFILSLFFQQILYLMIFLSLIYCIFFLIISYFMSDNLKSILFFFFMIFSYHLVWYLSFLYGIVCKKYNN